jgi:hypothetical protein
MNRIIVSAILGGAAALGASAFANDSTGSPTHQTRKELFQQCMELQRTQNSGATDKDMKKACHEQVKMQIAQQRSEDSAPSTQTSQPGYPSSNSPAPYNPPPNSTMPRP